MQLWGATGRSFGSTGAGCDDAFDSRAFPRTRVQIWSRSYWGYVRGPGRAGESAVSVPPGCTFSDAWTRKDEHVRKIPVSDLLWRREATSLMPTSEKAAFARTYPLGEPKSKNNICSEQKEEGRLLPVRSPGFPSECAGFLDAYLPGCELCGISASAPSTGRTASWTCCCSRTRACAPSRRTASAPAAGWSWSRRWTWSRRSLTSVALWGHAHTRSQDCISAVTFNLLLPPVSERENKP